MEKTKEENKEIEEHRENKEEEKKSEEEKRVKEEKKEENKEQEKVKEEKSEEEIIGERKDKAINFFKKRITWISYAILAIILWINIKIRSSPIPRLTDVTTGGYTLGPDLDPFLFLRYAEYIVEHGSLMKIDMMRYLPLGYDTSTETKILPYMIAYLHKFINFFSEQTVEYAAIIFPVVFSVITTIFFFLLVKKIFENKGKMADIMALVAAAFLVVLPSLLPRTIAGIPEKESAGFAFLFASFYFFLVAWKSNNLKKSLIFGILAGVATGLMGLIWGAWIFIFISIAISVFLVFIFEKVGKREFFIYSVWFIISIALPILFSERYTLKGLLVSVSSSLSFAVLLLLLVDFVIFHTKIKNISLIQKLRKKIPDRVISLSLAIVFIFILSSLMFGVLFIPNLFYHIAGDLTSPFNVRHALTVAENRQPYFDEWRGSFGPDFKGQPLFFWLFFVGSVFLFYEMIKSLKKKERYILIGVYIIFLFSLIFSRSSAGSIFNGTNNISKFVYFGGMFLLAVSFIYVYHKYHKNDEMSLLKKINFSYLLVFVLFFISLIAARSAVRLIMTLAPPGAIIISYFVVSIIVDAIKTKEGILRVLTWTIAIIVIIASLYTLNSYYQAVSATAPNYAPSSYTVQWQKAMAWVRENTPEDAVFGHWWDYGYWVQTIGDRATMLDGGNAIGYWNYLMGRHGLTAETEEEALELLYSHNVTYFLIDPTDIGKYSAYSSIGSDENYDRLSWIGTFLLSEEATRETKDEITYYYQGGITLDEDYLYEPETGEQIFIPSGGAGVGALILKTVKEEGETFSKQPEAIFVYQGRQINIPLRYLYYEKLYDFGTGYEGALYLFPRIVQQGQGIGVNDKGAALFLSERNMRALWVRLYLLNQDENFELVHSEPSLFVESLRNQGLDTEDIVYFQGNQGPIKIWKINYKGDEEVNPEYVQTRFPERIKQREFV